MVFKKFLYAVSFLILFSCSKEKINFEDYYGKVNALETEYVKSDIGATAKVNLKILGFWCIPEKHLSRKNFDDFKAAGFDYNITWYSCMDSVEKALQLSAQAGVKTIINCPEIYTKPQEVVARFKNNPGNGGYYIYDEPGMTDKQGVYNLINLITDKDSSKIIYLNLLPKNAGQYGAGETNYTNYVNTFIVNPKLKIASFDRYPIVDNIVSMDWYENLELFSHAAKAADKEFWAFALATAHVNYKIPDMAQLRLQQYTNLAYGAKGLQYFTYWTPDQTTAWDFNNGPIKNDGLKSGVYDLVKNLNEELRNVEDIFTSSTLIKTYQTGVIPSGTIGLTKLPQFISRLKTFGVGATISFYENEENNYMLIVNKDINNKMGIQLKFNTTCFNVTKKGTEIPASGLPENFYVNPGDAVIYRIPKI